MLDKNFQQELLEKLKDKSYDCQEVLFKYKDLGMNQHNMYKNMFKIMAELRMKDDEEAEDDLMDLMDCVVGLCSSTSAIFENRYTPSIPEQTEIDLVVKEVNTIK